MLRICSRPYSYQVGADTVTRVKTVCAKIREYEFQDEPSSSTSYLGPQLAITFPGFSPEDPPRPSQAPSVCMSPPAAAPELESPPIRSWRQNRRQPAAPAANDDDHDDDHDFAGIVRTPIKPLMSFGLCMQVDVDVIDALYSGAAKGARLVTGDGRNIV